MASLSIAKKDIVACEYCYLRVEGDGMNKHLKEDCEKVDGHREQTPVPDNTTKKLSLEDKLKNMQEEFTMRIQEQQQAMEQRFQEQQHAIEMRLQEQQEESRNNLNRLDNAIRNQLETHRQEQLNVMRRYHDKHNSQFWMVAITIIVAVLLALVLGLSQEQTITQQEFVNTTQIINSTMYDLAEKTQQEFVNTTQIINSTMYDLAEKTQQEFVNTTQIINSTVYDLAEKTQQENTNFSKQLNDLSYQIPPSEECGGPGWRRVAFINMTDPNQDCPQGLNLTDYSIRSCGRAHTGGGDCSSVTFPVGGLPYSQVCGRVTAYRWGENYAFSNYHTNRQTVIDDPYVDGLSLTHGSPRTHIWSFASGLFSGTSGDSYIYSSLRCPCDPGNTYRSPPFVGNDYFCDSVATVDNWREQYQFFPGNALWDGEDLLSTCYGLNNPPWFKKTLPVPTTNDIELRMGFNNDKSLSDIGVELLEVYTH